MNPIILQKVKIQKALSNKAGSGAKYLALAKKNRGRCRKSTWHHFET